MDISDIQAGLARNNNETFLTIGIRVYRLSYNEDDGYVLEKVIWDPLLPDEQETRCVFLDRSNDLSELYRRRIAPLLDVSSAEKRDFIPKTNK